ncbi:MAG: type I-C CRISPR-associated protein Cas8c/Csd1 [Opitutales bacterium]
MILQALTELFARLPEIDQPGFASMGVSWAVVLDQKGKLLGINSLRQPAAKGNKTYPLSVSAPTVGIRTSASRANFLVDKSDYVFGCKPGATEDDAKKLVQRFELFRKLHLEAQPEIEHPHFDAVCAFLKAWNPTPPEAPGQLLEQARATENDDFFGANFVFQISGTTGYVHELSAVKDYWGQRCADVEEASSGLCLISGQRGPLARLHAPAIKGVTGAQSSGASIVSFNRPAFESYGKEQSLNAPVGVDAAFKYCTTLNYLLAERERRLRLGDATTVYWTDQPCAAEQEIPFLTGDRDPEAIEDEKLRQRIQATLEKLAQGRLGPADLGDSKIRFFILGLAPNASRLSVRFWHTSTLGDLITNLQRHHDDLRIIRQYEEGPKIRHPDPAVPSFFDLLRQSARVADDIPPLLGGALMRAILQGTPYPAGLAVAVLRRVRIERNVTYLKAAILKAWLVRNHSIPVPIMLDESNTNLGYRLGRLFAMLENVQFLALGDVNTSIRERSYASASGTPANIFPRLMRGYTHHISKLSKPLMIHRETTVSEILEGVKEFPAHMNLRDQGLFALGYYHQRKQLFTKKTSEDATEATADVFVETQA